ncbi:hypothetical protein LCGC14_1616700 [marine sediment metagenome]|uniref:Uncharacterized protein n=1 Tax=marine sediment metagenome TaxID=412755 RepID=A0A0F9KM85_9ZZZZ
MREVVVRFWKSSEEEETCEVLQLVCEDEEQETYGGQVGDKYVTVNLAK